MSDRRFRPMGQRMDTLRVELQQARIVRGRTLSEVGRAMVAKGHLTWDAGTVQRLERGKRTLTLDESIDIVAVLINDTDLAIRASPIALWLLEAEDVPKGPAEPPEPRMPGEVPLWQD